jgi:predicted SprT family Zn-dependent metalloprotease
MNQAGTRRSRKRPNISWRPRLREEGTAHDFIRDADIKFAVAVDAQHGFSAIDGLLFFHASVHPHGRGWQLSAS